jgi:hypothetical protein
MTEPTEVDVCWPVDTGCCNAFDDYDIEVQDRAIALATSTMRALTGFQVGGCPRTVRPCTTNCDSQWGNSPYYGNFYPLNWAGVWTNCGCQGGCIHNGLELPKPVGSVDRVTIDGVDLDPDEYRTINGNILIRTDGEAWPTTQDLTKPDTEDGTWSVTYLNAYPVDANGAYAAGLLACEYAKACSGSSCSLPSGVREIARAGVTMTIAPGAFPNGLTGIRAVDAYLRVWNPNGLTIPSTVYVPGKRRFFTWR